MLEFVRRHRVLLSSGFFLLCSLALVSANARQPGRVDPLGRVLLEIMVPFQRLTAAVTAAASDVWHGYVTLVGVARENARLRTRLRTAEQALARHREVALMNRRLQALLALQARVPSEAVAASVTARDATVWFESLILDKGEAHGIEAGMPVLAPEGAVGVIAITSRHASRVLLVSDPNSGIEILVQRTRVRGIVSGHPERGAVIKYVKRSADVRPGDLVVASGLDGVFPKGTPVGTVTAVTRGDSGLFLDAELALAADASRLEEVLVARPTSAALLPPAVPAAPELVGPPSPEALGLLGPPAPGDPS